ncbi:Predicted arabinose efflux permease, MFS family [Rhodoblastus acidophilus]|uniref:Predicted arabinose efflux permease, MFS family n=1 Tax=Rhodoblastus acidophilus TaxID=1074 RepID=A0A212S9P1_RHOAC|nr:MFS transporter [Rhodoblastus acidophilus]PPQ36069.1 MFS transporter [Rhodoblastus acidophilus]RAI18784.1 MFS transporter [Rhodoblastus acidophilus]SNB82134.1 Predicted arabinose efflux permease, MFS family [Rhodoblastus acidophilus]
MQSSDARRLLLGYLLLNASIGIAVGMTQLALPLFAFHLGASPAEIGVMRAVAGAGLLLTAIPAGLLNDRFGSQAMFHIGNVAGILCCLMLPSIQALSLLLFALGAEGVARSVKFNALSSSFYRALPLIGVDKVGWSRASFSIGLGFVGPLLGGALVGRGDFAVVFFLAAAIQLVPSLIFARLAPMRRKGASAPERLGVRGAARAYAGLLAHRDVPAALGAEAISAGCFNIFNAFIGVAVTTELAMPAWKAGLFVGAEGVAYIFALFLLGRLAQRHGYRAVALSGLALLSLALTGVSLSSGEEVLIGFSALLGVGLGLLNLAAATRAATLPGEKGKVAALFSTAVSVGIVVAPIYAGIVATFCGCRAVFIAFVPTCLLLAAYTASRRADVPLEEDEAPETA